MQGYEDTNDVKYLKNDPLLQDVLDGELAFLAYTFYIWEQLG